MTDLTVETVIAVGIAVSVGIGYYATTLGRNPVKWFFISLGLSPVIAFALLHKAGDLPTAMK